MAVLSAFIVRGIAERTGHSAERLTAFGRSLASRACFAYYAITECGAEGAGTTKDKGYNNWIRTTGLSTMSPGFWKRTLNHIVM